MRPAYRSVLLALLAALALSGLASASAEAKECKHEKKGTTLLCIEHKETTGEVPFAGKKDGTFDLHIQINSPSIGVNCETVVDKGAFLPVLAGKTIGLTKRVIEFGSCKTSLTACGVKPIVLGTEGGASGLAGEIDLAGGAFQQTMYPASEGIVFGTIKFTGANCLLGSMKITTEKLKTKVGPVCGLPKATEEAVEHTIECTGLPGMNNIEVNEGSATLSVKETVALSGANTGKKWDFFEG